MGWFMIGFSTLFCFSWKAFSKGKLHGPYGFQAMLVYFYWFIVPWFFFWSSTAHGNLVAPHPCYVDAIAGVHPVGFRWRSARSLKSRCSCWCHALLPWMLNLWPMRLGRRMRMADGVLQGVQTVVSPVKGAEGHFFKQICWTAVIFWQVVSPFMTFSCHFFLHHPSPVSVWSWIQL